MKNYRTTKKQCQASIDNNNNVCEQCGNILSPIETVDNSGAPTFWSGCLSCLKFSQGVKKDIFEIAQRMVKEKNFIAYDHLDRPDPENLDAFDYWEKSQIGGATYVVRDVLFFKQDK